jgi:hypothetical protein
MKVSPELFKKKRKCFRKCWTEGHYLTYRKQSKEFIEHIDGTSHVWFWKDMIYAIIDLVYANDWEYIDMYDD